MTGRNSTLSEREVKGERRTLKGLPFRSKGSDAYARTERVRAAKKLLQKCR